MAGLDFTLPRAENGNSKMENRNSKMEKVKPKLENRNS